MYINFIGSITFAFVALITPGPNNIMLFAYGRTNNIRAALKLMLGIASGFFVLLCLSGYGIAQIITANHTIGISLKILSSIWLIYLGWLLSKTRPEVENDITKKLGFKEAFMMQFINPKAWIMAIAGAAAFMPDFGSIHLNVLIFAITFMFVGFPCMVVWLKMSKLVERILKSQEANKNLGYVIFALMIISAVSIWI